MKIFLLFTLGFYTALGSLCPMQLEAATFARESHMPMMSAVQSDVMEHMESSHADRSSHADCGEEDHCQLGESVDSVQIVEVQELPVVCFACMVYSGDGTSSSVKAETLVEEDRPPPLSIFTTVVLRQ